MSIYGTKEGFSLLQMGSAVKTLALMLSTFHLLVLPLMLCLASDSISEHQHLQDGQTLISTGGVFELGFFSPNRSDARYVGMWYKGLPVEKVVWVANVDTPLTDTSGVVMIGNDGNLVIVGSNNSKIWSTEVALTSNHTIAVLLDSGNLVLKENELNGQVLWESFNHLSDTYLPQMKLGVNTRTGEQTYFRSWKNNTDPSPGNFLVMVDPQDVPEIVLMKGSTKYWRSGQWNGRSFLGVPTMTLDFRTGFHLIVDNQGGSIYFTNSTFNGTFPALFYLTPSGIGMYQEWDFNKKEWSKKQAIPNSPCDIYNTCGSFGKCTNEKSPICECLKGYQPKSVSEWKSGNWKSGCTRVQKLQCERNESSGNGKADGFFELTGIKLPDLSHYIYSQNRGECEAECLSNCSCIAYAYVEGIGCMIWEKDLIDLQEFPSGRELYLKLAYSELGGKTKVKVRTFVFVLIVIGGILVMCFMTYILWRWKTKIKGCWKGFKDIKRRRKGVRVSGDSIAGFLLGNGKTPEVPFFDLHTIEAATDHFSNANKLGQGGFGPVYKGKLPDGQEVAVKRLSRSSGQGTEEFKNEVILIAKLQHRNLVRLLGFCIQREEKLLVYEYMPNKSLDSFIFGSVSKEQAMLNWDQRFIAIEGIARGLLYLHHDSRLKIIHRDLKTSNILLDYEMNPKISDFGMARIFGGNQMTANTNRVVGTYGYMSPEYAMQGIFSEKSDVFSFGVLLLEIVSSKRNTGFHQYENSLSLSGHAWQLWNDGKAIELFDPRLSNSYNEMQAIRCINIGLLCVQDHPDDRPTMATVVSMLCSDMILPTPKQPAFSHYRIPSESSPSVPSSNNTCSRNVISESVIEGR